MIKPRHYEARLSKKRMIHVKPVPTVLRVVDHFLWPVMFFLGGLKTDSIQETHYWHCQPIDSHEIDPRLSVMVVGDDKSSSFTNRLLPFPIFHAPLFGGWKNYVLLQVQSEIDYWFVGWIHRTYPTGSRPRHHVQRLPIATREVRVLSHPNGFTTEFFAIGPGGQQLLLRVLEHGVLGDCNYPNVRLL